MKHTTLERVPSPRITGRNEMCCKEFFKISYVAKNSIPPTNLQFLVFGRGEDYGMKYALSKETIVLLFPSLKQKGQDHF
jgi:hypothetical protein